MTTALETVARIWPQIEKTLSVPHTEAEYNRLVALLDELIDDIGEDETHPLASLMETIGSLIEAYETHHVPEPEGHPIDVLKLLMNEHGLTQSDLPDIGSQGVVSEILSGKRQLNGRQIKALSKRFDLPAAVFLDTD